MYENEKQLAEFLEAAPCDGYESAVIVGASFESLERRVLEPLRVLHGFWQFSSRPGHLALYQAQQKRTVLVVEDNETGRGVVRGEDTRVLYVDDPLSLSMEFFAAARGFARSNKEDLALVFSTDSADRTEHEEARIMHKTAPRRKHGQAALDLSTDVLKEHFETVEVSCEPDSETRLLTLSILARKSDSEWHTVTCKTGCANLGQISYMAHIEPAVEEMLMNLNRGDQ